MIVKIDAPGLYILFGKGHVNFGTLWSDNRRMDDIAVPARKTMQYYNHIDMNEFTNISLLYDLNEMQIMIDGEERYYSKKERYMNSLVFSEMNEDGFELKIACDKLVNVCIKSLSITEYDDFMRHYSFWGGTAGSNYEKMRLLQTEKKPVFEKCISLLPEHIQSEIFKTDEYLKSLKSLKFKKTDRLRFSSCTNYSDKFTEVVRNRILSSNNPSRKM